MQRSYSSEFFPSALGANEVKRMALHEVKLCLLGVKQLAERSANGYASCAAMVICSNTLFIVFFVVQDSGVGKTCIVNRFVSDIFSEHEALTVG